MATVGNPWLRGVKGKLAGMVVQGGTTRGTTIIRERVTPTDPNTTAQKIQRSIMSTVGVAYSKMVEIADHAFEGYSGKAANMNRFRSLNANMLRQFVAAKDAAGTGWQDMYDFSPKGTQWLASNAWVMSEGSLPRIPFALDANVGQIDIPTGIAIANFAVGDEIFYSDLINWEANPGEYTGLSSQGMKLGDQITICGIRRGQRASSDGGQTYGEVETPAIFSYCRFILAGRTSNSVAFQTTGGEAVTGAELVAADASIMTQLNGWTVSLAVKQGYFYLRFQQPLGTSDWERHFISTATAILSRKVNAKWLRSPSTMSVSSLTSGLEKANAFSLGEAMYREGAQINTASDYYLNNAQQVAG